MDPEYRIAIRFLVGAVIQLSATDNPAPALVRNADDNTAAWYFSLDTLLQIHMDGIGEIFRRGAKGNRG
jgi:hypothetical protein